MPELPEVEHTRKNLERWLRGARIGKVHTSDARIVRPSSPRSFVRRLEGRTVKRIDRRGKWLRLELDDGRLFVHLGMTGWFAHASEAGTNPLMSAKGGPESPFRFERVRLDVEREGRRWSIVYVDPRRWGRMVLSDGDIDEWTELGPDPLVDGVDVDALAVKLARRRSRSIKEALLDQTVLAGVGNVQATEALWKAGIDPRSRASTVTKADLRAIARGIRWTIERTLSNLDKARPARFSVYGRRGEPCPRCGARLERVELGGRSTTLCPRCQASRSRDRSSP
jgi:formamidopyrimidine-DNA glycosylase